MTMPARSQTLFDLLQRSAARHPQRLAIACGDTQWSYAQFADVCERLARGLHALGVQRGSHVALLSRNSHAFAAMRFALARLGAVLVPVNFMLGAAEAGFILRHSESMLLASDSEFAPVAREAARASSVRHFVWLESERASQPAQGMIDWTELLRVQGEAPQPALQGSEPAQIVYTSGTESAPKGAVLSHEALLWEYVSCVVGAEIASDDLLLHALPLFHCAQLDVFLGPAVYVGASNVITAQPSPQSLLALLGRHRISSFFAPPTVWIGLLRCADFDTTDLGSLRKGYYGASIMPVAVLRELAERLPRVRLWNLYGQTEIAPLATLLQPEDQLRKPGSAGRAALNVRTRVVDDQMRDVAPGEVGEIVHRSPQLMSGYFRDQAKTEQAFDGGWFHSGDLGTLDDEGYLYVVDRKKDMIKTGGENVASREVEECIYLLPQVSEAAVVALPHPRWIEAVTAFVVLKAGQQLDEAALIAHCESRMAHFKAPKKVVFVDALPKNPSGKLLKRRLRDEHAALYQQA